MVYLFALAAGLSNALTSIMQRMGVEKAPEEMRLRIGLMTYALRRPIWLAGFAIMIASFLFQVAALSDGPLSIVQPVMTTELIFLVAILAIWFKQPVDWHEWGGALAAAIGLASFLYLANPGGGDLIPSSTSWGEVGIACIASITILVFLARSGSPVRRSALLGTASAIAFALTASLEKVTTTLFNRGIIGLFSHWQPYAIAVTGVTAVFLAQNAFHAGPITASQATLVIVDPLVSIIIGVELFGDHLQAHDARLPMASLALLIMFAGVFLLCLSPAVSSARGETECLSDTLATARKRNIEENKQYGRRHFPTLASHCEHHSDG
ncbi:MAG: DMT family transporter [Actinobacteria bacterium]|jgi:drug/metabolite transporter (DMT)-like permease|nr:DMT family transporter [Actinomycetota bacterium]MCL6094916.1 DMT family transporter [Actinomycetota bacterium]